MHCHHAIAEVERWVDAKFQMLLSKNVAPRAETSEFQKVALITFCSLVNIASICAKRFNTLGHLDAPSTPLLVTRD